MDRFTMLRRVTGSDPIRARHAAGKPRLMALDAVSVSRPLAGTTVIDSYVTQLDRSWFDRAVAVAVEDVIATRHTFAEYFGVALSAKLHQEATTQIRQAKKSRTL